MFRLKNIFSSHFYMKHLPNQSLCVTFLLSFILATLSLIFIQNWLLKFKPDVKAISSVFQQPRRLLSARNNTSYLCDYRRTDRLVSSTSLPPNASFNYYRTQVLAQYCDIVPIPRNNWTKSISYAESDIVFVIFTGARFYHTRATAVRDTWLARVTNYYFLSGTSYPYLPVTVIENTGEDKISNMKKLFYGLDRIYRDQMQLTIDRRQKWFYIIGCDTFVLSHHLVKRLDNLDHQQATLLGGHWGRHICFGPNGTTGHVDFPSGGAGFFLSMKLLEMMQPHLIHFVENVWPKTSEISDVALTCLAKQLGIELTKREGFWAHPPRFELKEHLQERFHADKEPNDFHYVQPDEMYALDEFYVHQHMDRLINDENWSELIEFSRRFVISHYDVLRKKRRECSLPNIISGSNRTNA